MLTEYRTHSQITLPKVIVENLGLSVGDMFDITERDGGIFLAPMPALPLPQTSGEGKRELLRSLYGSIDDPTFAEPPEIPWESPQQLISNLGIRSK